MAKSESGIPKTVDLFGIAIDRVTMAEALDRVLQLVRAGRKDAFVVTPNVDHVVKLQSDADFRAIYAKADLTLADGMPVVWVSKLVKNPLPERVTGADLFVHLCELSAKESLSVFLMGASTQEIIDQAASKLLHDFPGLKIVGAHSPSFGFERNEVENQSLVQRIRDAKPDLLFVGVGAPKQEKWIDRFRDQLGVPVSLGVGAAFDFVAGSVSRAPLWMQKTGLEWFYRFLSEPKRMYQRYFVEDRVFFGLAMKEWTKARQAAKNSRRSS